MEWIKVVSDRINAVAYDAKEQRMYLKFPCGKYYVYNTVTKDNFDDFMNSASLGHALQEFQKEHDYEPIDL